MRFTHLQILFVGCLLASGAYARAQGVDATAAPTTPQLPEKHSIEELNLLGADAYLPPFEDSVIKLDSPFRRTLEENGLAIRTVAGAQYTQNTLSAPVAPDSQVYVGQRDYFATSIQTIVTADLRQLHLHGAQLNISGVWNWASWGQASPKTVQISTLYLYKSFWKGRVETKAGYTGNDLEFIGLLVGGNTATAGQGVYAVLPYEVGLAYYPLAVPTFNVRLGGPKGTYVKTALQRSLDPSGGVSEVDRNHTGLRFAPHGDKLFNINELGYRRDAAKLNRSIWLRAGYMRNTSLYPDLATGQKSSGNYAAYVLGDYQLHKSDELLPSHGLYIGGSVMTAPSHLDPYDRYYEARVYQEAPFHSRPDDLVSLVASHTGYSSIATGAIAASGGSFWRSSSTITSSYALHASRGNYLSVGLSYIQGAAITPRVHNALNVGLGWTTFF